jgi:ATP-dependent RNA helicase DDX10/DBP4
MAASRTGSGKTLAYLVPLVEKLYRSKFIPLDGLGAIVLVPVRELAMQVFEVLNSFTKSMELSVGMIIGGKDVQYEKQRIQNMNILVCTPGRLLQHIEETYGFETANLQMLVLDEADEMLQLGFRETLDAILRGLPHRQTMLFSATLNKTIHSLASLSLNSPERIFLHTATKAEEATASAGIANIYETPLKLAQYYMIVEPSAKLNTLYSFIKEHPKKKILVFLSTCKQVRFTYEAFKTFKFGCPLYELQGRQKQTKRMAIFYTFCEKQYGVLFCTNIASRGLDFPKIDWVIQVDIPEDVETYVHRVGRTARFRSEGRALTLVTPSE